MSNNNWRPPLVHARIVLAMRNTLMPLHVVAGRCCVVGWVLRVRDGSLAPLRSTSPKDKRAGGGAATIFDFPGGLECQNRARLGKPSACSSVFGRYAL